MAHRGGGTLSGIVLERVEAREDAEWESFLDGPTDGTLFHRLSFLSYHPQDRFRSHHLRATRKGRTIALIPLGEADGPATGGIGSPYGGSFGGFATAPGLGTGDHVDLLDALIAYAKAGDFRSLWISSRPSPYRVLGDGVEYALAIRGAVVVRRDVTHIANVMGTEEEAAARVRGTARRGARKAERLGTIVRVGAVPDLPAFHELLAADRARLRTEPTHQLRELEYLLDSRPQDYRVLLAENDGALVGGVLLFRASAQVALSFYTARADTPAAERCMNLLMEHALAETRAWGCTHLDYGTSSILGELNRGLAEFKEGFGGLSYVRETWRLELG